MQVSHLPRHRGMPGQLRWLIALIVAALLLVGCSGGEGAAPSPPADGWGQVVPAGTDLCDQIVTVQPPPGQYPRVVLVVDNTASGAGQLLAPAVRTALAQQQEESALLDIVGVNGGGARPLRRSTIPLDPSGGEDSVEADEQRAAMLDCIDWWAAGAQLRPTAPGSDILAAFNEAGRQRPAQVIVSSDGVATAGELTLDGVGLDDPGPAVEELRERRAIVRIEGVPVLWTQLGEMRNPPAQALRTAIQAVWQHVLSAAHAKATFETETRGVRPGEMQVPDDPWAGPKPPPDPTTAPIPSPLLFAPDSADLAYGATDILRPVAQRLISEPRLRARIKAHCADFGDEAGQAAITRDRADRVIRALVALGVPSDRLTADPRGAADPAANEWPQGKGGPHDRRAAAENRRVEIVLT